MNIIPKPDLDTIKKFLNLDHEMCGSLFKDTIVLKIDMKLSDNKDTNCTQNTYTKFIWHTHPIISPAYPSMEDIVKILKKRNDRYPEYSLIFTSWGIWQLHCKNKNIVPAEIREYITKRLDKLYFATEKGRAKYSIGIGKEIQYCMHNIVEYTNRINKFGLTINFTPWDWIREQYCLG